MSVIVRFAPSPTGHIHIGNARTALFNWLYALQNDGQFVLRFDDTDQERSKQEYADAIAEDIQWLGIKPSRVESQSKRFDAYNAARNALIEKGLLYACYETPDELDRRRKILLSRKLPPVYGREALKYTEDEIAAFKAEGRVPHYRFLLPNFETSPFETKRSVVEWDDLVRGPQMVDLASISDPVLIREDGTYLYTLPSVVDDIDMGVTTIIRGDDHVTNTGAQIPIFEALGAKAPTFGHHNLLTSATGEGLSKRKGALSIAQLRDAGQHPMAVACLASLIGTSDSVTIEPDMAALAAKFDVSHTTKSAAKFDPADLDLLTATITHELPYAEAAPALSEMEVPAEVAEAFWLAVRKNCDKLGDAAQWWSIVQNGPTEKAAFEAEDKDYLAKALELLPEGPYTQETWGEWTGALKQATGRKGKQLFMPLRLAITGLQRGPELADLLPLLGLEGTRGRLL